MGNRSSAGKEAQSLAQEMTDALLYQRSVLQNQNFAFLLQECERVADDVCAEDARRFSPIFKTIDLLANRQLSAKDKDSIDRLREVIASMFDTWPVEQEIYKLYNTVRMEEPFFSDIFTQLPQAYQQLLTENPIEISRRLDLLETAQPGQYEAIMLGQTNPQYWYTG